jgi:hypothetical protein
MRDGHHMLKLAFEAGHASRGIRAERAMLDIVVRGRVAVKRISLPRWSRSRSISGMLRPEDGMNAERAGEEKLMRCGAVTRSLRVMVRTNLGSPCSQPVPKRADSLT